jgi:hypothetical protein
MNSVLDRWVQMLTSLAAVAYQVNSQSAIDRLSLKTAADTWL